MLRIVYALTIVAIAALVTLAGPRGSAPLVAQPIAQSAGGSLSVWNSRSGEALLRAGLLAPGDSTSGVVTIGNAGSVTGFFSLAQASLDDKPGPNGGVLSQRLELTVSDVSRPTAPLVIYRGKLGEMTSRPLGDLAPGQARTFRFTAAFPDGYSAVGTGGDNAFVGSTTTARYRWLALGTAASAVPAPAAPAAPAAQADRRPPKLAVTLPRGEGWLASRRIVFRVRCHEACALSARASLRAGDRTLKASMRTRTLPAGHRARIVIKLSHSWRQAARRALRGKLQARFSFAAIAHDAAANKTRVTRRLKLRATARARR